MKSIIKNTQSSYDMSLFNSMYIVIDLDFSTEQKLYVVDFLTQFGF